MTDSGNTNYYHSQHNSFQNSNLYGGQHFYGSSGSETPESQCLRYLYASDYESHKSRNPPRVPGTLEWFLNHKKFRHWRQEQESSLLWVSGDPGCGKSVLASFLVDELNSPESQSELPGTVCFFFFKDDDEQQKNATSALSALLHQLFKARIPLIRHAMEEFKPKGEKFTKEFGTLWRIFTAATKDPSCGHVICIIDGLDECEELTRINLINSLVGFYARTGRNSDEAFLKFILTSRPYGSIERRFGRLSTIRLKAEEQTPAISADIELVVKAEVEALEEVWDLPDDVRTSLRYNLIKGADRTFLWVSLILNILKHIPAASPSEFHKTLNSLPNDLDAIYEKILRDSCDSKRAKTLLEIVVAAGRPLTLDEMDIALAIQPEHKSIEDLKPYRPFSVERAVKDICGLFVRVIDSKIYLIHQTAKEFLIKGSTTTTPTTGMWKHSLCPIESSLTLAKCCTYYLLFTAFEADPLVLSSDRQTKETDQRIDRYTREHAFLDYAAKHWASHAREAKIWEKRELSGPALEVLDSGSRRLLTWFLVYQTAGDDPNRRTNPQNVTSLTVASYFGDDAAVKQLIEKGADVNGRDDLYGSALNSAAFRKHSSVVRLLLDSAAVVYLFGSEYRNLLQSRRKDFHEWWESEHFLEERRVIRSFFEQEAFELVPEAVRRARRAEVARRRERRFELVARRRELLEIAKFLEEFCLNDDEEAE